MKRIMLSGKIHTARITRCLIDYEGSLEIDPELLKEANTINFILVFLNSNKKRRDFPVFLLFKYFL